MLDNIVAILVFGFLYLTLFSGLAITAWLTPKFKDDKSVFCAQFVIMALCVELIVFLTFGFVEWLNWPK